MSLVWPRPIATLREAYLSLALTVVYTCAHAQVHEKRDGAYVLRSSTVASVNIDAATARAHGIYPAPTLGVINVMVSRVSGQARQNVPADVSVTATSLTGRRRHIKCGKW